MGNVTRTEPPRRIGPWRIAGWGFLAAFLVLPLIAMQFTPEVQWTGSDFVFAALALGAVGIGVELTIRVAKTFSQSVGMLLAVAGGFLTVWLSGAVGIVGQPDNVLNPLLAGAAVVGGVASLLARFRPRPMAVTMALLAVMQLVVMGLAMSQGEPKWQPLLMFLVIWSAASLCFLRAWSVNRV